MRLDTAYRLSAALTAGTWGLLVFGAAVRVHGAGLACPDWPLCFGQVIPPIDFHVGLEFGHRVVAGIISLGFLALGAGLFRARAIVPRGARMFWGAAAVALGIQIVLGGLTVLELLAEWTVTSHLLAGNVFCLLQLLTTLSLQEARGPVARAAVGAGFRVVAVIVAALVPLQLALGGLVASSHAGLACATFPLCNGDAWVPTLSGLVGLQVTHRLVAYLLLGACVALVAATRGRGRVGRAAWVVLGVVTVQASIGIANVLLRLPVEVTLLHSSGAAATVLATGWLHHEVWRSPMPASEGRTEPALTLEGA